MNLSRTLILSTLILLPACSGQFATYRDEAFDRRQSISEQEIVTGKRSICAGNLDAHVAIGLEDEDHIPSLPLTCGKIFQSIADELNKSLPKAQGSDR